MFVTLNGVIPLWPQKAKSFKKHSIFFFSYTLHFKTNILASFSGEMLKNSEKLVNSSPSWILKSVFTPWNLLHILYFTCKCMVIFAYLLSEKIHKIAPVGMLALQKCRPCLCILSLFFIFFKAYCYFLFFKLPTLETMTLFSRYLGK